MNKEDKLKALDAAISQIERQHGKGTIMKLGDSANKINVETIPTGSLSLDLALGVGGIPKGRVVEIYGPESSGKTTVALHMIAEAQKRGGVAGFIDAEHALDPVYAKAIGVDIDNLYISQPDYGELALEITETMVRSGAVDIIIVDSVAASLTHLNNDTGFFGGANEFCGGSESGSNGLCDGGGREDGRSYYGDEKTPRHFCEPTPLAI